MSDAAVVVPDLPGPATLTGTATRTTAGALTLDAQATATGVSAGIDLTVAAPDAGGAIIGSVVAEVADLAPFADLAGRPLAGGGEVLLSGQAAPDLSSFDVTAVARTRDLAIGIPQADALLAGEGSLDGRITRTEPRSLRLTDFRVTTATLTATGTADLTPDGGAADLDIRLADVAPFLPGLTGPATVTGTATRDTTGTTAIALDATGPGTTARIDGTLSPAFAFDGTVAARIPDLAPYAALAGQPLSGGIDVTAQGRADPSLTDIDLRVTGTTRDIQTGIAQIDPLLTGPGAIDIDLTGSWPDALTIRSLSVGTPGITLTGEGTFVNGAGIAAVRLALPDIAPIAPGFSGPATFDGAIGRDETGLIQVEAAVTAPSTTANVTATIKTPEFGNHTELSIRADVADLAVYRALTGLPLAGSFRGTIDGSVTPGADAFDLTVNATATNLNPGNATAATLLRGTGTVAGRVSMGTDANLRLRGLDIRFPNFTISGEIGATRNGGTATLDARLADLALIAPDFSGPATVAAPDRSMPPVTGACRPMRPAPAAPTPASQVPSLRACNSASPRRGPPRSGSPTSSSTPTASPAPPPSTCASRAAPPSNRSPAMSPSRAPRWSCPDPACPSTPSAAPSRWRQARPASTWPPAPNRVAASPPPAPWALRRPSTPRST